MSYKARGRGRGSNSNNNSWDRKEGSFSNFSQHDDRYDGSSSSGKEGSRGGYRGRSTSYRGNRGGGYRGSNRGRYSNRRGGARGKGYSLNDRLGNKAPEKDNDGDVYMDGETSTKARAHPYQRPSRPQDRRKKNNVQKNQVFQITVIGGASVDAEWLHKQIEHLAMITYTPLQFHLEGNNCSFFIRDHSIAGSIRECNKKIVTDDNRRFPILMKISNTPILTDDEINTLKEILSSRFDPASQHLNVSDLHVDPGLKSNGIFFTIPAHSHMYIITTIIKEYISSLVSLDLSNNRLRNLDGLKYVSECTPHLKKLDISQNYIREVEELEKIREWDLMELSLKGNPVSDNMRSKSEFVADVREMFPSLIRLDGEKLPALVKFDLESGKLPQSVKDFIPDNGKDAIRHFVQNFFKCYDTTRSELIGAYHEDSMLTVSIPNAPRGPSLGKYAPYSRNLKRTKSMKQKISSVSTGRTEVISKLDRLPPTKHYMNMLSIDVPFLTDTIVNFIVKGVYQECGKDGQKRAYSRNFFCKVLDTGNIAIINEQYFIRNMTASELREAKKSKPVLAADLDVSSPVKGSDNHEEMIKALSRVSGMNVSFSNQCLAENDWHYEKAVQSFTLLKEQGQIPPEAFMK